MELNQRKLERSSQNSMIGGVCGGLAHYLQMDPTVVRVIYVLVSFFSAAFPGILLYIVLLLIMPKSNEY